MKAKLRGLRDIHSAMKRKLASMPERACAQSEYEILSELVRLGKEKERLDEEKKNWQERVTRIDVRLREIARLEESLQQQMADREKAAPDVQDTEWAGREVVIKY